MKVSFCQYASGQKNDWDNFIQKSKNPHFFFQRNFLEYHRDRFQDFSLMIYNEKGKLIAVMPANLSGDTIFSHQGLTFGGCIASDSMKTEVMVGIFEELIVFLKLHNIKRLIYKCIPYIYHKRPAEEDRYALFLHDAKLIRRDVTSTIYLDEEVRYSKGRKWSVNRAKKENIKVFESKDFSCFWGLLESVLADQYNSKPVHTLVEIEMLAYLFPKNIRLFLASHEGKTVSGALVFENEIIVHTQYLANSEKGREIGALDLLIDHLIKNIFQSKKYFDFGTSNENQGRHLNAGLISQKEGFGARPVVHDCYELQIK